MTGEIQKQLKPALLLFAVMALLTGIIYPLAVTGLAQLLFPWQANGSLIEKGGKKLGSVLIGQAFSDPKYFWGRPSATIPFPYNATASSGSNSSISSAEYLAVVKGRISELTKNSPPAVSIPIDLITASGSGLDPDISPEAAHFQVARIASARKLSEESLNLMIEKAIKLRDFEIMENPRVNVLQLNLILDNQIAGDSK
jgi:K+-transporting ATPase ATPase C chain